MLLDCPRCRLTVLGAAFLIPPVDCPGCSARLQTRRGHLDAEGFEALFRAVGELARPPSRLEEGR